MRTKPRCASLGQTHRTVDTRDSVAEAVAIKAGRIVAVGGNAQLRALAGPGTETIDLHGLTATPVLLDAHCHFVDGALQRSAVDLGYPAVRTNRRRRTPGRG